MLGARRISSILTGVALLLQTSLAGTAQSNAAAQDSVPAYPLTPKDAVQLKCDQLAESPDDPQKVGPGVPLEQINVSEALPVCQQASTRQAWRPRYQFLYGRVLEAGQRYQEAAKAYFLAEQYIYPLAALRLGRLYETGQGVRQNWDEAVKWYLKATYSGFADGHAAIGAHYDHSNPPNYAEAVKWVQKAAQGGSAWGSMLLGWHYQYGAGVNKDLQLAARLYEDAAKQGMTDAMYRLGLMYQTGEGVPQNLEIAANWFCRAGKQGHHSAQAELGRIFYNGQGTKQDYRVACAWYLLAAQAGMVGAQKSLAAMYELGQGIAQNDSEAVAWLRKAADQNDPFAMTQLAVHLRQGRGVKGDEPAAMQWFQKAADQGNAEAESELGYGYMKGLGGGKQDYGMAAYWLDRAARHGDGYGQINLGILYENGWGVNQDLQKAKELYLQAARSPVPEIANKARELASTGPLAEPASGGPSQRAQDTSVDSVVLATLMGPAFMTQLARALLSGPGGHDAANTPPSVQTSTGVDTTLPGTSSTPPTPDCRQVPDAIGSTTPNGLARSNGGSFGASHLECN